MRLITYIHRNPQTHGLASNFRAWPYSSYHTLCDTWPTRLCRDAVWTWFGGPAQVAAAHWRFDDALEYAALRAEYFE